MGSISDRIKIAKIGIWYTENMKKKLENNPLVQKRLAEHQTIEKKSFITLLKKAVRPLKPSSKRSASASG